MPELPEVETMVRGIRPHVIGRRLIALRACPCTCRPLSVRPSLPQIAKIITGHAVSDVRRLGKRALLDFGSAGTVVIEPRMTGLILLTDPPDREHLRLEWEFAETCPDSKVPQFSRVWFWDRRGLGVVTHFPEGQLEPHFAARKLGLDALQVTSEDLHSRTRATSRPIKVLLLDQQFLAGIGNLYASEILHVARIHPAVAANRLTRPQAVRLAAAIRSVLEEAVEMEGSTLSDTTYRTALNESGRYQNRHRVYDRAGQLCPDCKRGEIRRIVQAQRSTFFCPACQKR